MIQNDKYKSYLTNTKQMLIIGTKHVKQIQNTKCKYNIRVYGIRYDAIKTSIRCFYEPFDVESPEMYICPDLDYDDGT